MNRNIKSVILFIKNDLILRNNGVLGFVFSNTL
jgi:hypothetical protein